MKLTCIECPRGCDLDVTLENGSVTSVSGNFCPKGKAYALNECVKPLRIITTTVRLKSGEMLPVKTSKGVAKEEVIKLAKIISKITAEKPIRLGQVLCSNIDGEGTDIVASASIFL